MNTFKDMVAGNFPGVGRVIPNAPSALSAMILELNSNRRVRDNAPYLA